PLFPDTTLFRSVLPKLIEPALHRCETFRIDAVRIAIPFAGLLDEPSLFQDFEVLRNRRARDRQLLRDPADMQRTALEQLEDPLTAGVGQCCDWIYVSHALR